MAKNFKKWPNGWPNQVNYPEIPVYELLGQTASRVPDRTGKRRRKDIKAEAASLGQGESLIIFLTKPKSMEIWGSGGPLRQSFMPPLRLQDNAQ
jgi:hypothetical protein